jgi:tetratricopeptide (TPR) repeat protein
LERALAVIDFSQLQMEQDARKSRQTEQDRRGRQQLIDSGGVSALDFAAPPKAVHEFNEAVSLMKAQHPQDAIAHWQKAIALYPKFISAYNGLGLAYLALDDSGRAKSEFELP